MSPRFFLLTYVPGYLAGLVLCAAQGRWEHDGERAVSHYGRIYNWLFFNDGYHAEHHADPGIHWSEMPRRAKVGQASACQSRLNLRALELLERLVLRSPYLQDFVLRTHRRAFRALLPRLRSVHRVAIIGGGLFPRTALILRELLPCPARASPSSIPIRATWRPRVRVWETPWNIANSAMHPESGWTAISS